MMAFGTDIWRSEGLVEQTELLELPLRHLSNQDNTRDIIYFFRLQEPLILNIVFILAGLNKTQHIMSTEILA